MPPEYGLVWLILAPSLRVCSSLLTTPTKMGLDVGGFAGSQVLASGTHPMGHWSSSGFAFGYRAYTQTSRSKEFRVSTTKVAVLGKATRTTATHTSGASAEDAQLRGFGQRKIGRERSFPHVLRGHRASPVPGNVVLVCRLACPGVPGAVSVNAALVAPTAARRATPRERLALWPQGDAASLAHGSGGAVVVAATAARGDGGGVAG